MHTCRSTNQDSLLVVMPYRSIEVACSALQEFEGSFRYSGSWQHTYLTAAGLTEPGSQPSRAPLKVQGFYSDILYQPWFCATTPIREEWLERDNLERRSGLNLEDFRQHFELPNRPVVLSDAVRPYWTCPVFYWLPALLQVNCCFPLLQILRGMLQ